MGQKAWVKLNSKGMPALRMPAMVAVNQYIHVVGGCSDVGENSPTTGHYIYNNDTDTWLNSGVNLQDPLGAGHAAYILSNNSPRDIINTAPYLQIRHWYDSTAGISRLFLFSGMTSGYTVYNTIPASAFMALSITEFNNLPASTKSYSIPASAFNRTVYTLELDEFGLPASGENWKPFITINNGVYPNHFILNGELYKDSLDMWHFYFFEGNYDSTQPPYISKISNLQSYTIGNDTQITINSGDRIKNYKQYSQIPFNVNNTNNTFNGVNCVIYGDTIFYSVNILMVIGNLQFGWQNLTFYDSLFYLNSNSNYLNYFNISDPQPSSLDIHTSLVTNSFENVNTLVPFGKYVVVDNIMNCLGGGSLYIHANPFRIIDIFSKTSSGELGASNINDPNFATYLHGICSNNHEIFCYGGYQRPNNINPIFDFIPKFQKFTWQLTSPTINSVTISGSNPVINFTDQSTDEQFFLIEKRPLDNDMWSNAFNDNRLIPSTSSATIGTIYNVVLTDISIAINDVNFYFRVRAKRVDI